jgi:hypothetical protein
VEQQLHQFSHLHLALNTTCFEDLHLQNSVSMVHQQHNHHKVVFASVATLHDWHTTIMSIIYYATKEIGLEVNTDKTKYIVMSRDRNAGRGHGMKIDNRSIERVEELKYLGATLTDQNSIQEEIKSRLKIRNACYYSVQNLLSSRLLYRNLKIKIYSTIILPDVLYGCETWSLTFFFYWILRILHYSK